MVEAQVLTAWLTPTYLFVFLNIILATIFLNHSKNNKNNHHDSSAVSSTAPPPQSHSHSHPQLTRTPSFFSRVASFNFSHYYHSEPSLVVAPHPEPSVTSTVEEAVVNPPPAVETLTPAPSLLCRVASFQFGWTPPPSEVLINSEEGKKIKEQEEEVEEARESHVNEEKKVGAVEVKKKAVKKKKVKKEEVAVKTTAYKIEDEEVDSKADDFINKFKHQLKLQRIESLLRYSNNNDTTTST